MGGAVMLNQLKDYAEAKNLVIEPGFAPREIRWVAVCDDEGRALEVIDYSDPSDKRSRGRAFPVCPDMSQSELVSGKTARSHFLWEAAQAVVLYGVEDDDAKTRGKHAYFVETIREAALEVPSLKPFAECLECADALAEIRAGLERQKAKPTDKLVLATRRHNPLENDDWHDWWRRRRKTFQYGKDEESKSGASVGKAVDLLDGEPTEPAPTHPKITGLSSVGGLATGDVLIGCDKDAFTSYGFVKSANAAMSDVSAHTYAGALNHLIRNHSRKLADALVVHWFKEPPKRDADDPFAILEGGLDEQELNAQHLARELLDAIRQGHRPDLADNQYFALTLSGASGRVMVRDWMEGDFEELVANVEAWFSDLSIVPRTGNGFAPPPKFMAVLGATVRDLKELNAPFVSAMWHSGIKREPIPRAALAKALYRMKVDLMADEPFNHARMGLIKACLLRNSIYGGGKMSKELTPHLNESHPSAAYQCGRLMAVLASLQRSALGDVGAGVVQRYYAAASTTPSLVLGRLTRTSQYHLNKLDGGLAHWYETRIAEIWSALGDGIPGTLTLEEQSLFALGYYQQIAARRAGKGAETKDENESENAEN
jgi:CRISPR-associated protein Csd1